MPRDRTGEEIPPPDDLFSGPHPAGCEHGTIEEHYDAGGHLLGHYRYDPSFAHVPVYRNTLGPTVVAVLDHYEDRVVRSISYPCPRCRPDAHARWAAGCWRTDGTHRYETCTYCQEDGRHAPATPR